MKDFATLTQDIWQMMLHTLASAEKNIVLEQYIVCDDEISHQLITTLLAKAASGVKIRLGLDAVGSRPFFYSDLYQKVQDSDIELRVLHTWRWSDLFRGRPPMYRTHRKILIVDDTKVIVTGVGFCENYADWHDRAQLVSNSYLATQLERTFTSIWSNNITISPAPETKQSIHPQVLTQSPRHYRHTITEKVINEFANAHQSIVIGSPYLGLSTQMHTCLRDAIARGVNVEIIYPKSCDSFLANIINWAEIKYLRSKGAICYALPCMNHSKYCIIDEKTVITGSANLDGLSLWWNIETSVAFTDQNIVSNFVSAANRDKDSNILKNSKSQPIAALLLPLIYVMRLFRYFT